MIWLNLLKNRCPACNSPLEAHLTVGDFIVCSAPRCSFKVTGSRMEEIVANMADGLVNPLTSNQEDKDYWES